VKRRALATSEGYACDRDSRGRHTGDEAGRPRRGDASIGWIRTTKMDQNGHYYDLSIGRRDAIDQVIIAAVDAARAPVVAFVQQLSSIFEASSNGSPVPLVLNEQRVAREVARAVVLDVVQSGIRSLKETMDIRSDLVLEIYETACDEADRAVDEVFVELRKRRDARGYGT